MSKAYDDSQYGIEKILFGPRLMLWDSEATGPRQQITLSEDILITELGLIISSTTMSGNAALLQPTLTILKSGSANIHATLTISTASTAVAIGQTQRTTTIATANGFSSGDILQFAIGLTAASGGGYPYIKYKARS